MEVKDYTECDSTESIFAGDMPIVDGSMQVKGNLEVCQMLTTKGFQLIDDNCNSLLSTASDAISFNKACEFKQPVQFNNGQTLIGIDTTYNSALVASPTIRAGDRLIVGESMFKITADDNEIIADRFKMSLKKLVAEYGEIGNLTSSYIGVNELKVNTKQVAKEIVSESFSGNELSVDDITAINLTTKQSISTTDIIVNGSAKVYNGITIAGVDSNGAALTVNGGEIVANRGIVSHTRNNLFQCMQIIGSGTEHDVCFRIDPSVDSLIEGNVTIRDSKLILENSKLYSDNITVTPFNQLDSSEKVSGIQLSSSSNWTGYKAEMIEEVPTKESIEDEYNPYVSVDMAVERNADNYNSVGKTIKSIEPINYMMEQKNPNAPKKFTINKGIHRIDSSGNALLKNVVSETGRFSNLDVYKLNVNKLGIDKIVSTSVASNVVDTDNLLKSRGIAEFDGVINTSADIFVESGSAINVAKDSSVVFQKGSELTIKDGAKFNLGGNNTTVKMAGNIEIDIAKLVFVDSTTGNKYKIGFRQGSTDEGSGIVMEYSQVEVDSTESTIDSTLSSASQLDESLSELGL